jgi:hypothetical protein
MQQCPKKNELLSYVNSSTPLVFQMPRSSNRFAPDRLSRLFERGFVENPFDKRGRSGGKAIREMFSLCASCPDKADRLVVAGPVGSALSEELVPDATQGMDVEKQRLWMWCGSNERLTNAHYDPFEGFVYVLRGKKRFLLRAPWEMEETTCAEAGNCATGRVVDVGEGEALYIPAFYFHTVTSEGAAADPSGCSESLSVTTWFKATGPLQQRLDDVFGTGLYG